MKKVLVPQVPSQGHVQQMSLASALASLLVFGLGSDFAFGQDGVVALKENAFRER